MAKMKELSSKYGSIFVGYYAFSYLSCLGGIYGVLESGVLGNQDMAFDLIRYIGLDSYVSPGSSNLVVAIALNEVFEVARFPTVVLTTPMVARTLSRVLGRDVSGPTK